MKTVTATAKHASFAVEAFRKEWPANFAGPRIDEMSGGAIRWSTTQNRRSKGLIPVECFIEGRPTLVRRDPFLDWWKEWLTAHHPHGPRPKPPVRQPVRRTEATPDDPLAYFE